jgi:phosphoribosylamine--glycine ligase
MGIDVLVVGGGGREHALVDAISCSPLLGHLYCTPGNAGIDRVAERAPVDADDVGAVAAFAEAKHIGLVVVGPEAPLVAGYADELAWRDIPVFGPLREAALIEGSKAFAKDIMLSAGVPTGRAEVFTSLEPALAFAHELGAPLVVKADGLAAGKGVVVCRTEEEAEEALRACLIEKRFGAAGETVLVEEFLEGEEASLLAIVCDNKVLPLAPAQDYKRIFDGDEGPNTGGMGSYSPVPAVNDELYADIVNTVVRPTVRELNRRGISYRGVLYCGMILTAEGPKVLEFNCRFGDPEVQVLIPLLKTDLLGMLFVAATGGKLPARVEWQPGACVGVVMASRGYPVSSSKGDVITGAEEAEALPGVRVYQAGTAMSDGRLVTAGGRVLAVTAVGPTFAEARARAYEGVERISFEGAQFRRDIGLRAEIAESQGHAGGVGG